MARNKSKRGSRYVYDSDRKRPKTNAGKIAKQTPIVREYKSIGMRLRGDVPQDVITFWDIMLEPFENALKEGAAL